MKKQIKIGNYLVGKNQPCFIIAEIGANHDQDIKQGKKMIDIAYEAGVDAVKFQSFTLENWISKEMTSFPTLKKNADVFKILKKCELSYELYYEFNKYAKELGLECFSTPSHIIDVDALDEIGVSVYKFGSVQITDIPTIKYAAKKNKPIILSTGASDLSEIKEAIEAIYSTGNEEIILLHCSSIYPTPLDQVNLNIMNTLQHKFDLLIGYSDHTINPLLVPISAIAKGACVFEKHITLDRNLSGPDHYFAIEPNELKEMVNAIRITEKILGSSQKKKLKEEEEVIRLGRRSIVAKRDIKKDDLITDEMLTIKRPGYGIAPKFLDQIIGKKAKENISKDKVMFWEMIK